MATGIDVLNSCSYLQLSSVSETETEVLMMVLKEEKTGGPLAAEEFAGEPNPELRKILASSRVIDHSPGCRTFEIQWPGYLAFTILDESFVRPEPSTSVGEGQVLKRFEKSQFLDFVIGATFSLSDSRADISHWAIYCRDHVVHIASATPPSVRIRHDA